MISIAFLLYIMCALVQFFLKKNVTFFEKKRKNPIEPRKFFRANAICSGSRIIDVTI